MRKIIPAVAMTLALAVPAFAQAAEACCCCKQDPANAHAGHDAHGADPDHAAHGMVTTPADGAMTDGSPDWFTATFPHAMTWRPPPRRRASRPICRPWPPAIMC